MPPTVRVRATTSRSMTALISCAALLGLATVPDVLARDGNFATVPAMTALSYKSPLIDLALSGERYAVKVEPESLRRLFAWVDTMGPYWGEEEIRALPDPNSEGIEEFSIRPRTKTALRIDRPLPTAR